MNHQLIILKKSSSPKNFVPILQSTPETENMKVTLKYRPVILEPLDDEMPQVPLAKRVY